MKNRIKNRTAEIGREIKTTFEPPRRQGAKKFNSIFKT
jgi:hypothetical protein